MRAMGESQSPNTTNRCARIRVIMNAYVAEAMTIPSLQCPPDTWLKRMPCGAQRHWRELIAVRP